MKKWQLQEAKAKLSEVVKAAINEGPQVITLRGKPTAVLVSQVQFEQLAESKPSFVEFMRRSPWRGVDLNIQRNTSQNRDIDL